MEASFLEVPLSNLSVVMPALSGLEWKRKFKITPAFRADGKEFRRIELTEFGAIEILQSLKCQENDSDNIIIKLIRNEIVSFVPRLNLAPETIPRSDGTIHLLPHAHDENCNFHPQCSDSFEFKFIELFAGIGGFRLALEQLGGNCVYSSEIDEFARETYTQNFEPLGGGDIRDIRSSEIPAHDILTAGFPCQPFSTLGEMKGFTDNRGVLFRHILRVAHHHRPKALLLENVPGLVFNKGGDDLRVILSEITACGYSVNHKLIDAQCLVPQIRERVYIVAIRSDLGISCDKFRFGLVPRLQRTFREVMESDVDTKFCLTDDLWGKLLKSSVYQENPRKKIVDFDNCVATLTSSYRKTLLYCQFVPFHPIPRLFTGREFARLQGFPETYTLPIVDRMAYKQVGNAVAPPVVALVAGALLCALQHSGVSCSYAGIRPALALMVDSTPRSQLLLNKPVFDGYQVHHFLNGLIVPPSLLQRMLSKFRNVFRDFVNRLDRFVLRISFPYFDMMKFDDVAYKAYRIQFRIPNKHIGCIFGIGGSRLRSIQASTGARVIVQGDPENYSVPRTAEVISEKAASCVAASKTLIDVFHSHQLYCVVSNDGNIDIFKQ